MDSWQDDVAESLAGAFDRAVNAAVDISIMKETGIKQGPTYSGNVQASTVPLTPGAFGVSRAGGLPEWVPMVAVLAVVALVAWKLAK